MTALFFFLLGAYILGLVCSFFFIGFLVGLGGNNSEIWKIFVYPIIWPISVPLLFLGKI